MAIKINDHSMCLEIDGKTIASARKRTNGWWEVTHWPGCFNRDQAITALTITGLLETGLGENDPLVIALREELR